ncbi:MAG: DNA starvation/stationary phase protection protein [Flavobacterium sp.]|nr:DNA starvation/stationary phase protection protein [Flavobacterium sp.]
MKPNIGISENHLKNSIDLLSKSLADEVTLYTKVRKFHWNVSGESFMELHKLFQAQYTELEEAIDEIAERINKLGGKTIGTMCEFLQITSIKESPNVYPNQKEMLKELLSDHETIIKELRKNINESEENKDAGTADFFTGLIQQHETMAWILRRFLS